MRKEKQVSVTTVLFDLDGTLLPMDQDVFVRTYFAGLARKLAPYGYEPRQLTANIWAGCEAMIKNDGSCTCEMRFWQVMTHAYGERVTRDMPVFDDFYAHDFDSVSSVCGHSPLSAEIVRGLRERGIRVALATNPVFPRVATECRIRWAGLTPDDFDLVTTYENSRYCKPRREYYRDILDTLGARPEECLMVGNDVDDDMPAADLGMSVFLLTDCLINPHRRDISLYPHGDMTALKEYLLSS